MADRNIADPASQCTGKHAFLTRSSADKVASKRKHVHAYHCPHCGHFHIGKSHVQIRRVEGNRFSERA